MIRLTLPSTNPGVDVDWSSVTVAVQEMLVVALAK